MGPYHYLNAVEHRNMFWHLEKHAKTTANTRIQPKILSLLIYEVLIDNTLDKVFQPFLLRGTIREYGCTSYFVTFSRCANNCYSAIPTLTSFLNVFI